MGTDMTTPTAQTPIPRRVSDIERKRLRDALHALQSAALDVDTARVAHETARIAYARVAQDVAAANDLNDGEVINQDGTIGKLPAKPMGAGAGASE